jgi:hypothetical protein
VGEGAFYRNVRVSPRAGCVTAEVEDDYHHMRVVLHHADGIVVSVDAEMIRAPWSTCPGAAAELKRLFTGASLAEVKGHGDKRQHCTHLYDMAELAADHVGDPGDTTYRIRISDPVDERRELRIEREGAAPTIWIEQDRRLIEPSEAKGLTLFELGRWVHSLDHDAAREARLLRWAAIIAHGRQIPLEKQSDATQIPPNCFTFQPGRKENARRVGRIVDFSESLTRPLDKVS